MSGKRPRDFVCVPQIILAATGLGPAQARMLELMWSTADRNAFEMDAPALVTCSVGDMARAHGKARKYAEKHLAALMDTGYVYPLRAIHGRVVGWYRGKIMPLDCQCAAHEGSCRCRVLAPVEGDRDGFVGPVDPAYWTTPRHAAPGPMHRDARAFAGSTGGE